MFKAKLSEFANIKMGQSPKGQTCCDSEQGTPLLNGPSEFTSYHPIPKQYTTDPKKICNIDDILFCVRGSTTGRMNWADKEYAIGRGLAALSHKRGKKFNHFLKYIIEYNINSILNLTSGSTFPNLTSDNLASYEFYIPNFEIQKKISKILCDFDAKIELNNKINSQLEAIAKTLYDYWFVQFDFPDVNGKPYKTSGGKMVWNEELKREIPEGWEVETLSKWINNDKSGDWGKEHLEGNYNQRVYCVRGADINGLNGKGEVKSPERYILEKNLHKILEPYDLIVEISGGSPVQSTGRLAYITEETLHRFNAPIICSNFCKAVTLKNKYFFYNFVYQWNSVYDAGVLFGYEGKTSGIKNLLFESFVSSYYTAIPPTELAEKFYEFMKPLQIKKEKNLKENQELSSLRDWLLPMLMNGQITVTDSVDGYEKEEVLALVAEPSLSIKQENEKVTKVISLKPTNVEIYKRTLLAAEIVYQLKDTNTLGHLKLQKMLYLCQEIGSMNLPMNFLKQAMGPYDNQLARSLDKQFVIKKWFEYQREAPLKYKPLENCGKHKADFQKYFESEVEQINYLINKFNKFTSNQIEAVATLYACWKEAVENKEMINDKLIITKFYQWSKEKEKFREENLEKALDWMRRNGVEPKKIE